jgi:hypothetical protein
MAIQENTRTAVSSTLHSFDDWIRSLGKTRVTGYRYRKRGLIRTVNIFGRHYITQDEIARFEERAIRGDFAQEAKTPKSRTRE